MARRRVDDSIDPAVGIYLEKKVGDKVARGETLTSIAKMYKVGVEELQNFNHIEDGRKLQAGQTIMIPGSPSPAPSASPSASE